MVMLIESNVAWFKLSESIMRNERERAFTLHRLLAYSIPSESFRLQILGDLHLVFNEISVAIDVYQKSFYACEIVGDIYGMYVLQMRLNECAKRGEVVSAGIIQDEKLFEVMAPVLIKKITPIVHVPDAECCSHYF